MNCWECRTCDVASCAHHPVWVTITAHGHGLLYRDPHDPDKQPRRLFELDNVLYPPDEAKALINLGFATLRQ